VINDVSAFAGIAPSNLKHLSITTRLAWSLTSGTTGYCTFPEQDICLHYSRVLQWACEWINGTPTSAETFDKDSGNSKDKGDNAMLAGSLFTILFGGT